MKWGSGLVNGGTENMEGIFKLQLNINPSLTPLILKQITDLIIKSGTLYLLEENIKGYLYDFGTGKNTNFLKKKLMSWTHLNLKFLHIKRYD